MRVRKDKTRFLCADHTVPLIQHNHFKYSSSLIRINYYPLILKLLISKKNPNHDLIRATLVHLIFLNEPQWTQRL